MINVAICNNMVTPYTNRLFNYLAVSKKVALSVISCTLREKIRNWPGTYSKKYDHIILKGIEASLGGARIFHINLGIWHALSRLEPDVVAINGIYPSMLIAAIWAFANRIPLVFLTDGWRHTMPQSSYHKVVRRFVLNNCRSIICSSEKGRRYFIEEGINAQRIFVAPLIPAWAGPKNIPNFDERPFHLLWCGRLNDFEKNAKFFVDLAIMLHARIPELRCRVVGDGPSRRALLDQLSRAGVNFDYTEEIPFDEMAGVFTAARMLAMPSKSEPWGLVCNEAMQCGTPCTVSPYCGVAGDLVKNRENGFVLDLNLNEWVDAIVKTVTDRSAWTTISKAALRASGEASIDCSGDNYIEGLLYAAKATYRIAEEK
jgi:glycosyltransferase involved in cell wall biosynthesis